MSPELAGSRGLADGDQARVTTAHGTFRMRTVLSPDLDPRVLVAEYGWWESSPELGLPGHDPVTGDANFNAAVSGAPADPVSGSLQMRGVACDVRPDGEPVRRRGPRGEEADGDQSGGPATRGERARDGRPFVVRAMTPRGRDVVELLLRPADDGPPAPHLPGQYVEVTLDGAREDAEVRRSYSLTSAPGDAHTIAVRLQPGGAASTHIHTALRVGDTVRLGAPSGTFTLPVDPPFPVVLMAAGVGITPFLGQLARTAAVRDPRGGARITVHKGDRGGSDICFGPETEELAARLPGLRLVRHLSRPGPGDVRGREYEREGRVTADSVARADIEERARFYLCGPDAMIRDITDGLVARGVPRFEIFAERFAPPVRALPEGNTPRQVTFRASGTTLTWRPQDGSLLDLAQRGGLRLPSGCRVGQCESCAVRLLSGSVAHLTDPPESDDTCLTCQSVPTADIVLDA